MNKKYIVELTSTLKLRRNKALVPTTGCPLPLDYACNFVFPLPRCCFANQHLATPLCETSCHPTPRKDPLSPNTAVFGDWLLLTYLNHDGYCWLSEHRGREELQNEILSPWGVLNSFTEWQVAFEHGKVLPYSISYFDRGGTQRAFDIRTRDKDPFRRYRKAGLAWVES